MRDQSGIAIFIILGAIGFYAALAYTVSKPASSKNSIADEMAVIDSAVEQQCQAAVSHARKRLGLFQQCHPQDISYELPGGGNANPDAPIDKSCHVFHANGAGLNPCGPYTVVHDTTTIGAIDYGDTETTNLLPTGHQVRCAEFGEQLLTNGGCARLEISDSNGENFESADICYAKTLTEKLSRGLSAAPLEFGREICAQNCQDTSLLNGTTAGTLGGNIKYYYTPDKQLEPYTGSCLAHIETTGTFLAPALRCDCWGSD